VLGLQLVLELAAAAIKTNTSEYFLFKVCEATVRNFQLLKPSKFKLWYVSEQVLKRIQILSSTTPYFFGI
jgi:hypothetical protein